ncbi:hypothetical protein AAFF_G00199110 [Aldrovandia affinis]|uniref:Uncharacterized protein n=1 Tax=Aldrovandia affinis TaxID=143900 RepID=A0AAD7W601_9TELE|nr:hypothetical protein AAFF_G00199110 [Aldrovandia affinis]
MDTSELVMVKGVGTAVLNGRALGAERAPRLTAPRDWMYSAAEVSKRTREGHRDMVHRHGNSSPSPSPRRLQTRGFSAVFAEPPIVSLV